MKRALFGFIAGFLATLIFHQIALAILHAAGMTPRAAWPMNGVPPFGVPAVISLAFWGGVWGAIMIPVIDRYRRAAYYLAAALFGAILPTLVAIFVVAPLKHATRPAGGALKAVTIGLIVNAAWGFGTALFYNLLAGRKR